MTSDINCVAFKLLWDNLKRGSVCVVMGNRFRWSI